MTPESILVETRGRVGLVTLNRPKALNALNDSLMNELGEALAAFDADEGIGAIVITGSDKAFAAGADIGAMKDWGYMDVYKGEYITRNWERMKSIRKPVIAAVAGYALGGGCELAMMCDIIIAADTAKFGQPEIKLGIIPGAGGTQRLPRLVGKARAIDLAATGRMIAFEEALEFGLIGDIFEGEDFFDQVLDYARQFVAPNKPSKAVGLIKRAIQSGIQGSQWEGLALERELLAQAFASADAAEGLSAYKDKRVAKFQGK